MAVPMMLLRSASLVFLCALVVLAAEMNENIITEESAESKSTNQNNPVDPSKNCFDLEEGGGLRTMIAGKWKKPQEAYSRPWPPLAYSLHCPVMMRQYACHTFDLDRAAEISHRSFLNDASTCSLKPFDALGFLAKARNKRLVLLGDSLQRQSFISLACLLGNGIGASAAAVARFEAKQTEDCGSNSENCPPPPFSYWYSVGSKYSRFFLNGKGGPEPDEWRNDMYADEKEWPKHDKPTPDLPEMECDDDWHRGHCWYPFATIFYPAFNFSIHYKWQEHFQKAEFPILLDHYQLSKGDMLYVEYGVHYHEKVALYRAHMMDLVFYLQSRDFPGELIFREYSPSHFDYSKGEDNSSNDGRFKKGKDGLREPSGASCSPIDSSNGWRVMHETITGLIESCKNGTLEIPYSASSSSSLSKKNKHQHANSVAHKRMQACQNVHYIPVYDASVQQWDAHFGTFGRKPGATHNVTDCTHWCLPGGPVDHWSRLFYNQLLNF